MKQGQRVRIKDGTYHLSTDKPTGTIRGNGLILIAGEIVFVYMVELDRTWLADNHRAEITHVPVDEKMLEPI